MDRLAAGAGAEAAEVEARLSKVCEGKGVDWEDDVAVSAFIAKVSPRPGRAQTNNNHHPHPRLGNKVVATSQ